uniref:(northern house mosquito) hypothetical protein n=2 Tax=Culex pipiens TaxID=7175 RepID=A0A8D8MXR6_CULPI
MPHQLGDQEEHPDAPHDQNDFKLDRTANGRKAVPSPGAEPDPAAVRVHPGQRRPERVREPDPHVRRRGGFSLAPAAATAAATIVREHSDAPPRGWDGGGGGLGAGWQLGILGFGCFHYCGASVRARAHPPPLSPL